MDTSRLTDPFLDGMRMVGDPLADWVAEDVFRSENLDTVNAMLVHIDENEDLVPAQLPVQVRDFLVQGASLPPWADQDKLAMGEGIFGRYAPQIITALHCAALPMCYAARNGVQVLAMTRRLQDYTYRRIMETAQFLMDVMTEGAFEPAGRGIRSSQKVRLLHAMIRLHIKRMDGWQMSWGMPINQEDLAGTLASFSACIVRSLTLLRIDLSDEERDAYTHIWSVVGHLLGIDERLLPHSFQAAEELMEVILRRQVAPSPEGQAMTRALIDYMKYMAPGNILDGLPAVLIRHLCGDEMADMLGVEPPDWTRALVAPFRVLCSVSDDVGDQVGMLAKLTEILGTRTLEGLLYVMRSGKRYEIRIPKSARERWGV